MVISMLRSCKYCGRIHDARMECDALRKAKAKRRARYQTESDIIDFRRTQAWTKKSLAIRERDNFLCQVCIRNRADADARPLNYDSLSVHHIRPLSECMDTALDDRNLITLCPLHHEMAEAGEISRDALLEIVREQESKRGE